MSWRHKISVREENAAAALEVMSRFAVNPRWLIYLPPESCSPSETSERDGYLEYPSEAFAYFARHEVAQIVCEEKHMGSRAVIVVCRDAETALNRFGVTTGESGVIYTRTGRHFFNDASLAQSVLQRLQTAISQADLWASLQSDWLCLDAEIMPWSAKAQTLIQEQCTCGGGGAHWFKCSHASVTASSGTGCGDERNAGTFPNPFRRGATLRASVGALLLAR